MIETCLKCGHVNNASTGDDAEACPQCGAIYSKVEMAMAAKQRPQVTGQGGGLGTTIGTGSGLLLIALASALGIWFKSGESASPKALAPEAQRARQAMEDAAKARQDLIQLAVLEKRVVIGMTAEQVQAAWGHPTSVNRTVSDRNTTEQLVYRRGSAKTSYVYLDNGVVRSFQVSE